MALKEKALKRLSEKMTAAGIVWAAGGDWLLSVKGIKPTFHQFDIVAADAEKADQVLTRLGMRHVAASGPVFVCDYHFDGADIRLYAGEPLGFSAEDIAEDMTVLGAQVHALSPERWAQIEARVN